MAITEFSSALNQVATERSIPVESVIDSIKMALATAYKKDRKEHGEDIEIEEVVVDLNPESGEAKILKDDKDVTPSGFGRIAAQTAKQVILQQIRETEKEVISEEFKAKIGEIVNGQVFRMQGGLITLDLGKTHAQGIMLQSEQVQNENYRLNQRLKVLVKDVRENPRGGTEIIVSRSDPKFVERLFEQEVPEIASGVVTIEAIAREAGSRTKMAVSSKDEKVDPVGSCVGQKGVRVQSIIAELFGEKIDIIPYSAMVEKFIAASLSPAKVTEVELDEEEKRAVVSVPEDQQSLAIGKEGQNARLANKLTHWKIDIKGSVGILGLGENEEGEIDTDKRVVGVWDTEITAKREAVQEEELTEEAEEDSNVDGDDKKDVGNGAEIEVSEEESADDESHGDDKDPIEEETSEESDD